MNNIAVLFNDEDHFFDYCPVFDNGAALFSDTSISYPVTMGLEECLSQIEAKPFSRVFDEQVEAAEGLYGSQLKLGFDQRDVQRIAEQCREFYPETLINRVQDVVRNQLRKYEYLRK